MNKHVTALAITAFLLSAASLTAGAFEVGVGGLSVSVDTDDGVSASVGANDNSVGVSVGGSDDNLASVDTGTSAGGGTDAGIGISTNDGQLVELDQSGNSTNGTVNLGTGGLLGGILGGGGLLPGGATPPGTTPPVITLPGLPAIGGGGATELASAYSSLSVGEQQQLRNKCAWVIHQPSRYDRSLLALCQLISGLPN